MFLTRKYIQFNDLVIDHYDMLVSANLSGGFKTSTMSYSFTHGSYAPLKGHEQFSTEQSLSMTLQLNVKKLTCDQRQFYKRYVQQNLLRAGRLWAVEGNQLLWTHAFVSDFNESYALTENIIQMDLSFVLYEGVWHKAHSKQTFLQPYDVCRFEDMHDFREEMDCEACCLCLPTPESCLKCLTDCEFLTAESSLCEMQPDVLRDFYKQCGDSYRIIHNCEAGFSIWGDDVMFGERVCQADMNSSVIAGQFYSDTVMESRNVTVTLMGNLTDPAITINGNTMIILGTFNGRLTINANGDMCYESSESCNVETINLNDLMIPEGHTLGWVVRQGMNTVLVDTHDCCDMACVFIQAERLTI